MLIRFTLKSMLVFTFRPPICVPNFSKIEARTHELWRFLQSVRNDEEENKLSRRYRCVKIATLLFLSMYSLFLCVPCFLGLHDTLPCVLIPCLEISFLIVLYSWHEFIYRLTYTQLHTTINMECRIWRNASIYSHKKITQAGSTAVTLGWVETKYLFVEIVCRGIVTHIVVLLNNWIEEIAGVVM